MAPGASSVPSASRSKSRFHPLLLTVAPPLDRLWPLSLALEVGCTLSPRAFAHVVLSPWTPLLPLIKPWQILQLSSDAISKIPRPSSDTIASFLDPCADWLHSGDQSSFGNNSMIVRVGLKLIRCSGSLALVKLSLNPHCR